MIIQNGQPRNYAVCNGRKVLMLRGGQWIIEFYPVLSPAVKSQIYADILDASLANEVWRAANLYCKAHQQAHPELTAQGKLLSTFVNNDPDMYASLPLTATPAALSAMPIRGNYTDGNAYARTSIVPNNTTIVKTFVKRAATGSYKYIFGASGSAGKSSYYFLGANNSQWYCEIGGYNNNFGTATQGVRYEIEFSVTKAKINGTEYSTGSSGTMGANTATISIGRCTNASGGIYDNPWIGSIDKHFIIEKDGATAAHFVPSKINGTMEWIDLQTLTLATRVGTFTEQKDLHNS